jgi:hypothetical protein
MAQLNQFSTHKKMEDSSVGFSSTHLPLIFAGILTVALFLGVSSCSKKGGTQVTAVSSESSAPVAGSPAPPAVAPALPPKKKVHKRRPATATYVNKTYGVSLSYPTKYSLSVGEKAQLSWPELGPVEMDFVRPGGLTLATLRLPENSYPDTDFASAFMTVSVNTNLSPAQCAQFAFPQANSGGNVPSSKVQMGSIEFQQVESLSGDARQADAKYYHAFQNETCYEFTLGLGTTVTGVEDGTTPVDREQVFSKLERILGSVKIETKPPAVEASPASPSETPVSPVSWVSADYERSTWGGSYGLNPARVMPRTASGFFMNVSQTKPVRAFSAMSMVMPVSMPITSVSNQFLAGLNAFTNP